MDVAKKPSSVLVTLKGAARLLRNLRVVGPVSIKKITGLRRHTQIEICGIEIDGFGGNLTPATPKR
jgi:hypothetical protein